MSSELWVAGLVFCVFLFFLCFFIFHSFNHINQKEMSKETMTPEWLKEEAGEKAADYVRDNLGAYNIRYQEAGRKDYKAGYEDGATSEAAKRYWKEIDYNATCCQCGNRYEKVNGRATCPSCASRIGDPFN